MGSVSLLFYAFSIDMLVVKICIPPQLREASMHSELEKMFCANVDSIVPCF